jgi:DNA-binding transcriptional MerR regulator
MSTDQSAEIKLAELAAMSGVPPRTIRLYIAKGLVPPPLRPGRDAAYGPEHLSALERVREGQRAGFTLERMRHELDTENPSVPVPDPVIWREYPLASDFRVSIRGDVSGKRLKTLRDAMLKLLDEVGSPDSEQPQGGSK